MTGGTWDGESFRRRMAFNEEGAERYAREHSGRLSRGQGNGSATERDRSLGEAFAYGTLVSAAATDHPTQLLSKLKAGLASPPAPRSGVDAEAWTDGFKGIYRMLKAEVKEHLGD